MDSVMDNREQWAPERRARLMQIDRKLRSGDLQPGETSAILRGERPGQMTQRVLSFSQLQEQVQRRRGVTVQCIDCEQDLLWQGDPLRSMPTRCRPCGQDKRRGQNQRYYQRRQQTLDHDLRAPESDPAPSAPGPVVESSEPETQAPRERPAWFRG